MKIRKLKPLRWLAIALISSTAMTPSLAKACTRALFVGSQDVVLTGRSMDWMEDMATDLWAFPRGMARDGAAGPRSPKWVSKYGSVIASAYNIASADGMNEKGLVANLLYLAEAQYGEPGDHPPLSVGVWAQYVLDNYASVAEAVAGLEEQPFRIVAPTLPNGSAATLHLAISDPTGDSAIFEYLGGKLVVHHGKQYNVMTNSPPFEQQLALNSYWQKIGGQKFLPGTNSAADRFARTSYLLGGLPGKVDENFIDAVPERSYANQAVAGVLSLMRSVSVPLGISTPGEPNIASTLWRTVSDQKDRVYFFDSSTAPNAFWVSLDDVDLSEGAAPTKLPIAGGRYYSGDASAHFVEAEPFKWLQADDVKQ